MKVKTLLPLTSLLLAVACASAPPVKAPPQPAPVSAPEWTSRSIYLDGSQLVFVVSGPEDSAVVDLALQAMTTYLDLPLGPGSPEAAARAVQKFLSEMSATKPSDRYARDGRGYWKITVPQDRWDAARAQLAALFQVASDPAAELEKGADALLKEGRYVDAATAYVAAAASASSQGLPPARIRAALTKAQDLVSQFALSSPTPAQTTRVGQGFPSRFEVKLTLGSGASAPVVGTAPLRFSYKAKTNGRLAVTGQTVKTDSDGQVLFELPVPEAAVRDSLVVLLDVNPWLEMLVGLPAEHHDAVSAFERLASAGRLQLPYSVESASKQVPMIVALADLDERGSVLKRQETTPALISALQKAGFQASGLPVNPTLLKSGNDNVILAAWKFQGKTTGRAVYGTVQLVSVTASGSQFSAEVSGTLKVVDLGTGKPVHLVTTTKVVTAGDKASASTQAFRQWAAETTATLEAELP